jgi:hypothetical protein
MDRAALPCRPGSSGSRGEAAGPPLRRRCRQRAAPPRGVQAARAWGSLSLYTERCTALRVPGICGDELDVVGELFGQPGRASLIPRFARYRVSTKCMADSLGLLKRSGGSHGSTLAATSLQGMTILARKRHLGSQAGWVLHRVECTLALDRRPAGRTGHRR